ncbi:MAG TPA: hypothetical protein VF693_00010 [Allosphingosinicella sp.]|jgi:hypothetical protein
MIRYLVAAALACAALATPAAAQRGREWSHGASGISLPREIGPMRLREERDASGGGNWDMILQYGNDRTPVTVYVYRAAYPNPALWFERTRRAMNEHAGTRAVAAAPRSFTLGGAPSPNGLREEIEVVGGPLRATAVAIAQAGHWMFKVRVSSGELDVAGVRERLDQILAAVRFAQPLTSALPLTVPAACGDANRMDGRRAETSSEAVAGAAVIGLMAYAEARGGGGLAAEPAAWCRDETRLPAAYGTVYRQRDGGGWVALLGDSGRVVAARNADLPGGRQAASFVSTPASTHVIALFNQVPHPDEAIVEALPVVAGQARGLAEISNEPPRDR